MSFKDEINRTVTYIVKKVVMPLIVKYITEPIQLKDGRVIQGQEAVDMAVAQNKDMYDLIMKYKPEYMKYLKRIDFSYINWDSEEYAKYLAKYLRKNGIKVDEKTEEYLYRQIENFKTKAGI